MNHQRTKQLVLQTRLIAATQNTTVDFLIASERNMTLDRLTPVSNHRVSWYKQRNTYAVFQTSSAQHNLAMYSIIIRYDTIEEINVDSKAKYTA